MGGRDLGECVDHREAGLGEVLRGHPSANPGVEILRRPVLAGEEPRGESVVRQDTQVVLGNERGVLLFVLRAMHQVVVRLQRHGPRVTDLVCNREPLGDPRGGVVRQADITDLAASDECVERRDGLVQWRLGVVRVREVQVDVIGLQTLERRVGGGCDILRRQAPEIG